MTEPITKRVRRHKPKKHIRGSISKIQVQKMTKLLKPINWVTA